MITLKKTYIQKAPSKKAYRLSASLSLMVLILLGLQSCSIILSHRKDNPHGIKGQNLSQNIEDTHTTNNYLDSLLTHIYKTDNAEGTKATPLMLNTPSGEAYSLYDVEAEHIILYFYDPSCKKCAAETVALYRIFIENISKGIMVYAVYTGTNKKAWERWIAQNNLTQWINVWKKDENDNCFKPYNISSESGTIYLLNKDKVVEVGELNLITLDYIVKKLM